MAEISELANRHPVLSTVEGWEIGIQCSGLKLTFHKLMRKYDV